MTDDKTEPSEQSGQKDPKRSRVPLWGSTGSAINAVAAFVTILEYPRIRIVAVIGPAILLILLPIGLTYIKKVRDWEYWNWALAATCSILLLILVITAVHLHGEKPVTASPSPAPSIVATSPLPLPVTAAPPASPVASPPSGPSASDQHAIRRHALLVLDNQGTAYDLDSLSATWDSSIDAIWTFQNIEYLPEPGGGLQMSDEPQTDVLMNGSGPWTYQDCVNAPYDPSDSTSNPNNISLADLTRGRGICVHTRNDPINNPGKTDGGHYILLVVQSISPQALTLEVTAWE
jgi:hypothetical protein